MRTLECGCELSPTGALISLCELHAAHVRQTQAVAKMDAARAVDKNKQWEMAKVIAPEIVRDGLMRENRATDTADGLFAHLDEIMRRLD